MDRDKLLKYLRQGTTVSDDIDIVRNYCIENGKEETLTDLFINAVIREDPTAMWLKSLANYVLEKESVKHVIVRIYNRNNQLIHIL